MVSGTDYEIAEVAEEVEYVDNRVCGE